MIPQLPSSGTKASSIPSYDCFSLRSLVWLWLGCRGIDIAHISFGIGYANDT
jgi:hypothetical protein